MIISYSKKETRNLGNYENLTIEIKVEDSMEENESPYNCLVRLKKFVTDNLKGEFHNSQVNYDTIKQQIHSLINLDENHKIIIKNMIGNYGVTKITDLEGKDLLDLNKKLSILIQNYK